MNSLNITILGLSITSSWGNGHATTFRGLVKGLSNRGHKVTFLERDVSWYASERDLTYFPYGEVILYKSIDELKDKHRGLIENSDCVIVGSYVPEGINAGQWVQRTAKGITAFYDIDTPVTLAKIEQGGCDYLSKDLISGYDLYLSFTGGRTLSFLEETLGSPKAEPLYCSFDPDLYYPQPSDMKWELGYMGTYSDDRQPGVNNLLVEPAKRNSAMKFIVAGPQYPSNLIWPKNVERVEHLPPQQHREFYNSQRYTLNITRSDMIKLGYSPSVRLFEAAGCAVPIISDYWEGLETIFIPGEEILIAENEEEVSAILNGITEAERKNIAVSAYFKALRYHTSMHRALQLEHYLQDVTRVKESRKRIVVMN